MNKTTLKTPIAVDDNAAQAVLTTRQLTKNFGSVCALDHIDSQIAGGSVYGLIGSNGAGKSTFLRLAAGVLKADEGEVLYKGEPIFDNAAVKQNIFFVPDTPWFMFDTLESCADFYRSVYTNWSDTAYRALLDIFPIDPKDNLTGFSKGMRRQATLILALASKPDLLLMDEAFDGLDPVMRQNLKRLLAVDVAERGMTVVIASHNLRELEDFCDHVGLLHRGGLLLQEEIDHLRFGILKVQVAFSEEPDEATLKARGLNVLRAKKKGALIEWLLRNTEDEVRRVIDPLNPLLFEVLPLQLEEIFIYELGEHAYAVHELL